MLDWFEKLLDTQYQQLIRYLNDGQIDIKEYDAAMSILFHLQNQVANRKKQTLSYKIVSLFRKSS